MKLRWKTIGLSAGALVVLAAAAAAIVLPYKPVVRAGKTAAPPPYVTPATVEGLRLHVFNTGMNRMSGLLVGEARPWRPVPVFVIEHPRFGLIVFDTGLSDAVARDGEAAMGLPMSWLFESKGSPDRTMIAQLRRAHLSPDQVQFVLISHLHDDHLGAAPYFTAAKFVGGPGAEAHKFETFAANWERWNADKMSAAPPFAGAIDLLGDRSILLIPGGGHTPEDMMAYVGLPSGPVLLAGDVIVHFDWLKSDDVQRVPVDPDKAADVRNQVRALLANNPGTLLFPGHDLPAIPADRTDIVVHEKSNFDPKTWAIETPHPTVDAPAH